MACANLVPGAGLTHALSGICEAWLDNVPMLVLGCGIRRDTGRAYQLHDVDQQAMVRPVTKGTFLPLTGTELYGALREACRLARAGAPGPVFVEVPADLYLKRHGVELPWPADPPTDQPTFDAGLLDPVMALLAGARHPLLYVGAGAAAAAKEVVDLAERIEAPVATTFQGKGVFPESHPLFLWPGFGEAAPPFARKVARSRDLTLAVGCRFGEVGTGSYGLTPPGPLVHVDIDFDVLGRNYPAEVAVCSDAGVFLRALLGRLEAEGVRRPFDDLLRDEIREGHEDVRQGWMDRTPKGVRPPALLGTCQELLGPDTIFTTDSGNGTFLAMECLRLEEPGKFLAPVDYSCMGYAVPAALGAKLARPDCPVVALAGDGAFLMTGLELATASAEGIGVIVLVLRDMELAQIAQFQATAMNRKVSSEVSPYDLKGLAQGVGAAYLAMPDDGHARRVLEEAAELAAQDRPVLVEVAIDYSEKTFFTRGVIRTNLLRLPLRDRLRFVGRAVMRKLTEG
jgi:acetolactate synthase-1/2/3 large subunit